jgi:periplasmic mercuric ion binding protein
MKKVKAMLLPSIILMLVLFTKTVNAQEVATKEIYIKTSAVCGMCKETIEKYMAYEKGVKKSSLDVETKILSVTYNPKKTTPEKIRLAVSKSGYDADDVKANKKAYDKLDGCCKKGNACKEK